MPSSSARCAQLPRAMDKVPFYSGLKKFRDYLNGLIPEIDDSEVIFNDPKIRAADDGTELGHHRFDGRKWHVTAPGGQNCWRDSAESFAF